MTTLDTRHLSLRRAAWAAPIAALALLAGCERSPGNAPAPKSAMLLAQATPAQAGSGSTGGSTVQPARSATTPMQLGAAASTPRSTLQGRDGGASGQDGLAQGSRGASTPGTGTTGGLRPSLPTTPSDAKTSSPGSTGPSSVRSQAN